MKFLKPYIGTAVSKTLDQPKLLLRALIVFTLVMASLVGLTVWKTYDSYEAEKAKAVATTSNLTQVLAQHTSSTLKAAEVLLLGLVERAETDGLHPPSGERISALLRQQVKELPQLYGLYVLDKHGYYIASSDQEPENHLVNLTRDYFIVHSTNTYKGTHLGQPIQMGPFNEWVVTLSRRIDDNKGEFAGVVLASVSMNFFRKFHDTLDIGEDAVIAIYNRSGMLLMRRPFAENLVGNLAPNNAFYEANGSEEESGTFIMKSDLDGVSRLHGFQHMHEYPLFVKTAVTEKSIFNDWYSEIVKDLLYFLGLSLVLAYAWLHLFKQITKKLRTEDALLKEKAILQKQREEYATLALIDSLTGLANRRQFDAVLHREIARAKREELPLSVLLIDVDLFKAYNDKYGHLPGDECLARIGQKLGQILYRPSDLAARYGGEEFAIILPGTDNDGAIVIAERVRLAIHEMGIKHEISQFGAVTVSVGSCTVMGFDDITTAQTILQAADVALYRAKQDGRNRVFCILQHNWHNEHEEARKVQAAVEVK